MHGLFAADSVMWKFNRENAVLLAGPAAAVLQVAHPAVARGVAAHSGFRTDPAGRLIRTLDAVYAVAFGTLADIERVRSSVGRAHRAVRGPGYSAFDPDAQLWVMATLIMGSAKVFTRFVGRTNPAELDRFLRENEEFGAVFGLPAQLLPATWREFDAYWNAMLAGDLLGSDPLCAEVANAVLDPPRPLHFKLLASLFRALALEFIPPSLARKLRIPESSLRRVVWRLLDGCLPAFLRCLPARLRFTRHYLQAAANLKKAAICRNSTCGGGI